MPGRTEKVERFLARHAAASSAGPLILPNPWDLGVARLLEMLGCEALATTSSGYAGTLGRLDYGVTRDETLTHARDVLEAVDLPVSADLENGFGDQPADAAETIRLAVETGLAGGSIEDFSGDRRAPIYERGLAVERVAAAAEVARRPETRFVLTARAENALHGIDDLDDTVARLRAFAEAGADAVYAPGLVDPEHIRRVVEESGAPVNVLLRPGGPGVAELAELGVARISVGGALHAASFAAVADMTRALLAGDAAPLMERTGPGVKLRNQALRPRGQG